MSTASELLIDQPQAGFDGPAGQGGDISQGSPSPGVDPAAPAQPGLTPYGGHQKGPVAPWLESVQDMELREFIQNKGWNDPGEMAQGYRNLEKLVGGEKVPLPKGDTDNEGWERVYKALGRPAKP